MICLIELSILKNWSLLAKKKTLKESNQFKKKNVGDIRYPVLTILNLFPASFFTVHTETQEQRVKNVASVVDLKPLEAEPVMVERMSKNGSLNRMKSPITATSYTVASLQTATNSFSQEYLIGEGSLGRVYKAEFPNRKVTYYNKCLILKFSQWKKPVLDNL